MDSQSHNLAQIVTSVDRKIDSFLSQLKNGDISEEQVIQRTLELEEEVAGLRQSCRKLPNGSLGKQAIYIQLQDALTKIQTRTAVERRDPSNWRRLPLDQLDLHDFNLSEAKLKIESHIRFAAASNFSSVTFIHGYNSGTIIRSFLWRSIADNGWPDIVPPCSHPDLINHLESFQNRQYRKGEFETTVAAVGIFRSFVFRSGRTTIPILKTP